LVERANRAVAKPEGPPGDTLKTTLLPKLQQDLAEFQQADVAEDTTRANLQSGQMALLLYKTELSQAREAQLGAIQRVFGDRERIAQFTMPWRKASKRTEDEAVSEPEAPPAAPFVTRFQREATTANKQSTTVRGRSLFLRLHDPGGKRSPPRPRWRQSMSSKVTATLAVTRILPVAIASPRAGRVSLLKATLVSSFSGR
jgi:hypothetical protein